MFCLMDVSGSMSEHMKDLAKRFYMLLYVFLKRRYKHVDIVFIRHTDRAEEVDEQTFFYGPASGGTLVSSALQAMHEIVRERFSPSDWNIYAAQASDGDNSYSDGELTGMLLTDKILPVCQFFAYLEVGESGGSAFDLSDSSLWTLYERLRNSGAPLSMRKVSERSEIFPVFHDLFQRRENFPGESRSMTERLVRRRRLGFPHLAAHPRCLRGGGDGRSRARRLSEPDRGDHRRADAGRLFVGRHAAVLQALVVRKALRVSRGLYRKGLMGLAYEIVINSSPCISYLMEENTATMQTLVIAHAAFGHNHFFKNNYLFKQWTDADGILDYLDFAKNYVMHCEERYGRVEVERTLDAAHALMSHGIDRYPGKKKLDLRAEEKRAGRRRHTRRGVQRPLAHRADGAGKTRPRSASNAAASCSACRRRTCSISWRRRAPRLAPWQRELLRIVRHIAQYFYPQSQTKVMNEGTATYVHYRIMTKLHQQGRISDGNFLEFLQSHTNVVFQPEFDDPRFSGFNPYALGFAMMQDIERIVTQPEDEDREWFPDIAGKNDVMGVLRDVWANYRDESFIAQFLSPKLMRQFRMFHLHDDPEERAGIRVDAIHDERGFRRVRRELARQHDVGFIDANIEVVDVDLSGDRRLILHHHVIKGSQLNETDAKRVLQHLADLWTYDVSLIEVDANDKVLREYVVSPRPIPAAA